MQKSILLYTPESSQIFDSFKDLFQQLSENGVIVDSLTDGKIETNEGDMNFTFISAEGSKDQFVENVEEYRTNLRASIVLLKKQGISVSKEELAKLSSQFEFLNVDKEKEEIPTEEESPTKVEPEED